MNEPASPTTTPPLIQVAIHLRRHSMLTKQHGHADAADALDRSAGLLELLQASYELTAGLGPGQWFLRGSHETGLRRLKLKCDQAALALQQLEQEHSSQLDLETIRLGQQASQLLLEARDHHGVLRHPIHIKAAEPFQTGPDSFDRLISNFKFTQP